MTGNGSTANPYVVSATGTTNCEAIQDCVGTALGPGLVYDDAGNQIRARISGDAGNAMVFGGDGGLYAAGGGGGGGGLTTVAVQDTPCINLGGLGTVPQPLTATPTLNPAAGNLLTCTATGLQALLTVGACGLQGAGTAASPLAARVTAWPYACPVDANAGAVYCDSTGALRSEPRGKAEYFTTSANQTYANVAVPATTATGGTTIETRSLSVTNPDACRPALAITMTELDIDFIIPAGGRAGMFMYGDETYRFENRGSATVSNVHTQTTKVVGNTIIPAGGTQNIDLVIGLGFGLGGATYNRIQSFIRAVLIAL
ncbi:hypothetical protein [Streptosporangium sp. NPDC002721]|uniref:hypothetical protein n=1 Tax=Streptosporangium sp. NPDC002721 TaxID=3366188 RepID=UPI00368985BB